MRKEDAETLAAILHDIENEPELSIEDLVDCVCEAAEILGLIGFGPLEMWVKEHQSSAGDIPGHNQRRLALKLLGGPDVYFDVGSGPVMLLP